MQPAARHRYTEEEYLALERRAETKSELIHGEVFAMAGAKPRHNAIAVNLTVALGQRLRLRGSPCIVFNSDQRLRSDATGMNTYADAVVACGPRFHAKHTDTLINPDVIVEVLSKSTEAYDRGLKASHYRQIPSLRAYLLVGQDRRGLELQVRQADGRWLIHEAGPGERLSIEALGIELEVDAVYRAAISA